MFIGPCIIVIVEELKTNMISHKIASDIKLVLYSSTIILHVIL